LAADGVTDVAALQVLTSEMAAYRDRWRQTERLAEQRLIMLFTGITLACTASAFLLSSTAKRLDIGVANATVAGTLWIVMSIIAVGVSIRLVRARISIVRSIICLNEIRSAYVSAIGNRQVRTAIERTIQIDSQVPPAFRWFSLPTAASAIAGASSVTAIALLMGGSVKPMPVVAPIVGAGIFTALSSWFALRAKQYVRTVTGMTEEPQKTAETQHAS